MAWSSPSSLLTRLLSGDPLAILIAFVVAFSLPILLHSVLFRVSKKNSTTPTFLLLGTSGAGKTSLLTLVRTTSPGHLLTRTNQTSSNAALPNLPTLKHLRPEYRKSPIRPHFSCQLQYPSLLISIDPRMTMKPDALQDIK